jgi:hypothetical protein
MQAALSKLLCPCNLTYEGYYSNEPMSDCWAQLKDSSRADTFSNFVV